MMDVIPLPCGLFKGILERKFVSVEVSIEPMSLKKSVNVSKQSDWRLSWGAYSFLMPKNFNLIWVQSHGRLQWVSVPLRGAGTWQRRTWLSIRNSQAAMTKSTEEGKQVCPAMINAHRTNLWMKGKLSLCIEILLRKSYFLWDCDDILWNQREINIREEPKKCAYLN